MELGIDLIRWIFELTFTLKFLFKENSSLGDYHRRPKGIPDLKKIMKDIKRSLDCVKDLHICNYFDADEEKAGHLGNLISYRKVVFFNQHEHFYSKSK